MRSQVRLGGEGGIRTHGSIAATMVFKTIALVRYATSPNALRRLVPRPERPLHIRKYSKIASLEQLKPSLPFEALAKWG